MSGFLIRKKDKNLEVFDKVPLISENMEIILSQHCNLACAHCMRGNPTAKEISEETLDAIFSKFMNIGNLSLGGGELSLSPHLITMLTNALKKRHVIVNAANFTTNGTYLSNEFIDALKELENYIIECRQKPSIFTYDSPPFSVCVSLDDFHLKEFLNQNISFEVVSENLQKYAENFSAEAIVPRLSCDVDIISMGRAENLTTNIKKIEFLNNLSFPYYVPKNKEKEPRTVIVGGIICFSTDGEFIPVNCSFENEKVFSSGNINKDKMSTMMTRVIHKEVKTERQFNHEYTKNLKRYTASDRRWKKYLKSIGRYKLAILDNILSSDSSEENKQMS